MAENLSILISEEVIAARVKELAARISADYGGKDPVAVGILKGAWIFMADLLRRLTVPLTCDFIGISSYDCATESSGHVRITSDLSLDIKGRHVLVIEDIIDTGLTTRFLLDKLGSRRPESLKVCTLLDKAARRKVPVPIDYVGFTVPDRFLVGYGLDRAQKYRHLPYVAELIFSPPS